MAGLYDLYEAAGGPCACPSRKETFPFLPDVGAACGCCKRSGGIPFDRCTSSHPKGSNCLLAST